VVIVGGGIQGCETAEFLVKRGRQLTIVEAGEQAGAEIPLLQRILLLPWLERKGTEILTGVTYDRITAEGMQVTGKDGLRRDLAADTILLTLPLLPNHLLFEALQGLALEVYTVGDCRQPGLIIDAIADGFVTGRAV
jgi:2,4-dienoyl-CoA reductase (NADPH2)